MPGFGHDPFGHYPFGHPPAAATEVTPAALTAALSIPTSALSGELALAAPLTLLLTTPGVTMGVGLSPEALVGLLGGLGPDVTAFSLTRTPEAVVGVLSIPPYTVDFYADTVFRTPDALVSTLSLLSPTVSAVDTQLEPAPLVLTLSLVPPAQPVDATQLEVNPLTVVLSLPAIGPFAANWATPAPLTAVLLTGGAPSSALAFVPNPLRLTLVLPRYFVFAGLPYSVGQIRVYEPWEQEPALAEAWDVLTEAGLPWSLRARASGLWELVVRVREPWQVRGRNP